MTCFLDKDISESVYEQTRALLVKKLFDRQFINIPTGSWLYRQMECQPDAHEGGVSGVAL